jgi:hypothetical protein
MLLDRTRDHFTTCINAGARATKTSCFLITRFIADATELVQAKSLYCPDTDVWELWDGEL